MLQTIMYIGDIKMPLMSHLIMPVLIILCMCATCSDCSGQMDVPAISLNKSDNTAEANICLNLDRVEQINSRKNATVQNASEAEEYAVYDSILGPADINRSLVVINENTTTGCPHCSAVLFFGVNRSSLLRDMPSLDMKTLDDFEAKNDGIYQLKNLFKYKGRYAIVNDSELLEIFTINQTKEYWNDWDEYYFEKCPHSPGIRYFSRVGFNSNMDQALVQDGFTLPYILAGTGQLVLLEKINGSWNVTDSMMVWIT